MMKTRKKVGLRRAHRRYHGRAVRRHAAIATGCSSHNESRQRFVNAVQITIAPPVRIIAAGPLASTAAPRNKQNSAAQKMRGKEELASCNVIAAETMARHSIALKGMSVAAEWEKPTMATEEGAINRKLRARSHRSSRNPSQASASVASKADNALGKRAAASLTPKILKLSAAPQ